LTVLSETPIAAAMETLLTEQNHLDALALFIGNVFPMQRLFKPSNLAFPA